jgi:hypothetical protein
VTPSKLETGERRLDLIKFHQDWPRQTWLIVTSAFDPKQILVHGAVAIGW